MAAFRGLRRDISASARRAALEHEQSREDDVALRAATARIAAAESRNEVLELRGRAMEQLLVAIASRLERIETRLTADPARKAHNRLVSEVKAISAWKTTRQQNAAHGRDHDSPDHLHHWPAIAGHLGLKPDAARHLARTAGLPVFRIGKTVCASRSTLTAWMNTQEGHNNG